MSRRRRRCSQDENWKNEHSTNLMYEYILKYSSSEVNSFEKNNAHSSMVDKTKETEYQTIDDGDDADPSKNETSANGIPRMKLSDLCMKNKKVFNDYMETHSFVVLTDIGKKGEDSYNALMQNVMEFFLLDDEEKKKISSSNEIYCNENGTPMWFCGYEHTHVRDCFRIDAGNPNRQIWPSIEFQNNWLRFLKFVQRICDQALRLTLDFPTCTYDKRVDQDFSVSYALHYPNTEGTGQSIKANVFEHVDPSLYVIEPVSSVEGLEVFDPMSKQWINAEKICQPGKEFILFCGKALQTATRQRIPATLHRVQRSKNRRFCFIYEQKYQEFF